MGSAPSKSVLRREGLGFLNSSDDEFSFDNKDAPSEVTNIHFDDITTTSFIVKWTPPDHQSIEKFQLRIFPPEGLKCKTLINLYDENSHEFDRLSEGKSYTVGIVSIDHEGRRSTCATASESTRPVPPTMMVFPVKAITSSAVLVCWTASKGSRDYYEATISPSDGVTGSTEVTNLRQTEHTFIGLVPGTKYSVKVVSVSNKMQSPELTGTVTTKPGNVQILTFVEVKNTEISIQWKPPVGHVEAYTLRLIDSKSENAPVVISKIPTLSYKFNGLRAGRSYTLEIYSHALGKDSVVMEYEQCTVPYEVSNFSSTNVKLDSATVVWGKAAGDVDSYDLFLSPRDGVTGETCPSGITGSSYEFTGLVPGTTYTVGIVSNSHDKTSKRTVTSFITQPDACGEITFPHNGRAATSLEVCWLPSNGGWDSYTIYVQKNDNVLDKAQVNDISDTKYVFKDLNPGSLYKFDVRAVSAGRESFGRVAECSTLPIGVASIDFLNEESTSQSIKFKWKPAEADVTEDFVKSDCNEFELKNLISGTEYTISVTAISHSIESETTTATFTTGPAKVSDIKIETLSKSDLRVTWSPPEGGVEEYELNISPTDGIDAETEPKGIRINEYVFNRLVPGTVYTVAVIPVSHGVAGEKVESTGYTTPGDILNVHFPGDDIHPTSMRMVWGIEGNTTNAIVTLKKETKGNNDQMSDVIISETKLFRTTEHLFRELEENSCYKITLQATSEDGITGTPTTVSQSTPAEKKPPSRSSSSMSSSSSEEEFLE